jgi:hypothetical protein
VSARYAAQAVTTAGYGDPEIVVQPIGEKPNDWPTGDPAAALPIPGEQVDLDAELRTAGYRRVTGREPAEFGWVSTVVRDEP